VNHLFANLNSHLPLRLPSVPRNFHTIWPHRFLPLQSPRAIIVQPPFSSEPGRSSPRHNGQFLQSPEAPASGTPRHFSKTFPALAPCSAAPTCPACP
jgi:hypothetical protein